jgi:hypothetical protein
MEELNLAAPQSWKELSPRRLAYVSFLMTRRQLTATELQAYAFFRLAGVKVHQETGGYRLCSFRGRFFTLSPEQALSFSRKFSWLTSGVTEVTPLPRLKGIAHHDPRLYGCPFVQYLACENYYQAFIHTRDERYLDCLVASFYLGDEKFNDGRTLELSRHFHALPFHIRHTVFLWYYGLKSVFHSHFPHFFQKAENAPGEEPPAPDMRRQSNSLVRALTGGDITKTDAVYQIDTWTALAELDAKAHEYREMEQRIKKRS